MKEKALVLLRQFPWAALFALFILVYTGWDLTQTDREKSVLENRQLAVKPPLSWSVLMNGTYDEKYDAYINDQFAGRDGWITLKSLAESVLLKAENNGVVYGKDGYLFVKYDQIDSPKTPGRFQENVGYLREFFDLYPDQAMTLAVVPNAYAVLEDKLPAGLRLADQAGEIEKLTASLPANVTGLDLAAPLRAAAGGDAQLYYRTDPHWTTYAAYLAADAYARSKGRLLPEYDAIPRAEVPGFYGTNYSKAKNPRIRPDTVTWCDIPVSSVEIDGKEKGGLYQTAKFDEPHDMYAAFLWGNNNRTVIRSENNRYPRADGKPSRVLVIKDSFGNCFSPFLTYLYDVVDVVDLRFFADMKGLMEQGGYDDVILLYNFESLATDGFIPRLRY